MQLRQLWVVFFVLAAGVPRVSHAATVNIAGVDRVKLLQELFKRSRVQGYGALWNDRAEISEAEAKSLLGKNLDYLHGRVMKICVPAEGQGNEIEAALYDRDNGENAVEKIVQAIGFEKATGINVSTGPVEPAPVMVHLRNGAIYPVAVVSLGLGQVMALATSEDLKDQFMLFELVKKVRNPRHKIVGDVSRFLADAGLVWRDGSINEALGDIVDSMVVGTGSDMHYVNPVIDIFDVESCPEKLAGESKKPTINLRKS